MEFDEKRCQTVCRIGYVGQLVLDYEVCPFQYFCRCSCPRFQENSCEGECIRRGQYPVTPLNEARCKICSCEFPQVECTGKCYEHQYEIVNNTFGCQECKCKCPYSDCEAKCNGTGIFIPGPVDMAGCHTTCGECVSLEQTGTSGVLSSCFDPEHAMTYKCWNIAVWSLHIVLICWLVIISVDNDTPTTPSPHP